MQIIFLLKKNNNEQKRLNTWLQKWFFRDGHFISYWNQRFVTFARLMATFLDRWVDSSPSSLKQSALYLPSLAAFSAVVFVFCSFGSRFGTFQVTCLAQIFLNAGAKESKTSPALLTSSLPARLGLLCGCLSSPAESNRHVFTSLLLLAGEACRCAGRRFVSHTVKHNSS